MADYQVRRVDKDRNHQAGGEGWRYSKGEVVDFIERGAHTSTRWLPGAAVTWRCSSRTGAIMFVRRSSNASRARQSTQGGSPADCPTSCRSRARVCGGRSRGWRQYADGESCPFALHAASFDAVAIESSGLGGRKLMCMGNELHDEHPTRRCMARGGVR